MVLSRIMDSSRDGVVVTEPTLHAALSDTLSDVVNIVVQFDRMIAQLAGMRAEALQHAKTCSELAENVTASGGAELARRSLVAEIACALRMPERTAERLLNDSDSLVNDLPATLTALRSGSINYRHAQILVDNSALLEPALRARLEATTLPIAASATPTSFDRAVRARRQRLAPESMVARHHRAVGDRGVECTGARDGMMWLSAYLPAPEAVAIYSKLTEVARSRQTDAEQRTLTQLRADAFVDALLGADDAVVDGAAGSEGGGATGSAPGGAIGSASGAFGRIRPRILVTVPVLTLLGRGSEPAVLEGYGPIDPETARILTAEAPSLTRILTHPESGAVLSMGREKYRVPQDLRAWLRLRDGTCRFPNCGRSAANCDLDHTVDWQYQGETDWHNLAHLCPKHHKLKHEGGWRVTQNRESSDLVWTAPSGATYVTHQEVEMSSA
jgi:hypothetical protein